MKRLTRDATFKTYLILDYLERRYVNDPGKNPTAQKRKYRIYRDWLAGESQTNIAHREKRSRGLIHTKIDRVKKELEWCRHHKKNLADFAAYLIEVIG